MKWKELDKIQSSKNRHCNECSIDIIDFTQMSNEEIIGYLSERKAEKVCAKMYSANDLSRLSKFQEKLLNWHEYIKSNVTNTYFKSVSTSLVGLMLFSTGCIGKPVPPAEPTCIDEELVPDTTTTEPNDSIIVTKCDYYK